MFIAALFIIAKVWKQAKSLSTNESLEKMYNTHTHTHTHTPHTQTHTGILFSCKNEWNSAIWNNMDEPKRCYT